MTTVPQATGGQWNNGSQYANIQLNVTPNAPPVYYIWLPVGTPLNSAQGNCTSMPGVSWLGPITDGQSISDNPGDFELFGCINSTINGVHWAAVMDAGEFRIDGTPPVVSITPEGQLTGNWYNRPFDMTANDPESGIQWSNYLFSHGPVSTDTVKTSGQSFTNPTSSAPADSSSMDYYLTVAAVNQAGLEADTHLGPFGYDASSPTICWDIHSLNTGVRTSSGCATSSLFSLDLGVVDGPQVFLSSSSDPSPGSGIHQLILYDNGVQVGNNVRGTQRVPDRQRDDSPRRLPCRCQRCL